MFTHHANIFLASKMHITGLYEPQFTQLLLVIPEFLIFMHNALRLGTMTCANL